MNANEILSHLEGMLNKRRAYEQAIDSVNNSSSFEEMEIPLSDLSVSMGNGVFGKKYDVKGYGIYFKSESARDINLRLAFNDDKVGRTFVAGDLNVGKFVSFTITRQQIINNEGNRVIFPDLFAYDRTRVMRFVILKNPFVHYDKLMGNAQQYYCQQFFSPNSTDPSNIVLQKFQGDNSLLDPNANVIAADLSGVTGMRFTARMTAPTDVLNGSTWGLYWQPPNQDQFYIWGGYDWTLALGNNGSFLGQTDSLQLAWTYELPVRVSAGRLWASAYGCEANASTPDCRVYGYFWRGL